MTSYWCPKTMKRRPCWCPKTMKRRPCWCPKPVLWELELCLFLMQKFSFVPINLHRCWARERKRSFNPTIEFLSSRMGMSFPTILSYLEWRTKIGCKSHQQVGIVESTNRNFGRVYQAFRWQRNKNQCGTQPRIVTVVVFSRVETNVGWSIKY